MTQAPPVVASDLVQGVPPSRNCMKQASLNQRVVEARYAVRSAIVERAQQLQMELDRAPQSNPLPFTEIISTNIGNPHAMGQKPLTYLRQTIAACMYPPLLEQRPSLFPDDIVDRVKFYLARIPGGVGAYTESQGLKVVRDEVAAFIERRDLVSANPDDVMLCKGASEAVKHALLVMIRDVKDGIMIPIPQYPLYSSTITVEGGTSVGYYLDEATNWSQDLAELDRSYDEATSRGVQVRAMVVINPGNPTGQCLTRMAMETVVEFCHKHDLLLMADEVYQENVYIDEYEFISFYKLIHEMGEPYSSLRVISFHSASKGYTGECGLRGGYMHLANVDPDIHQQLKKLASMSLCSSVIGQLAIGLSVNPPRIGSESYMLFVNERDDILHSLRNRAKRLVERLNQIDGMTCTEVQGAMYAFPSIDIPDKAIEEARSKGMEPDAMFCTRLLERTGIVTVPGSGFRQQHGTWHFRLTILPDDAKIDKLLDLMAQFVNEFRGHYK